MEKIGNRFRREVKAFAEDHAIPILMLVKPDRSRWDDRKIDHVQFVERSTYARLLLGFRGRRTAATLSSASQAFSCATARRSTGKARPAIMPAIDAQTSPPASPRTEHTPVRFLLDACVLYPPSLRDLLLALPSLEAIELV